MHTYGDQIIRQTTKPIFYSKPLSACDALVLLPRLRSPKREPKTHNTTHRESLRKKSSWLQQHLGLCCLLMLQLPPQTQGWSCSTQRTTLLGFLWGLQTSLQRRHPQPPPLQLKLKQSQNHHLLAPREVLRWVTSKLNFLEVVVAHVVQNSYIYIHIHVLLFSFSFLSSK